MIPERLNEYNPSVRHHQRRIRDHYLLNIGRFWSPTIGHFDILKMWQCIEFVPGALRENRTHWFYYIKLKIRTESGDVLTIRKEYLDREQCFTRGVSTAPLYCFQ